MDAARESFKQNMKTKHPSKSTGQGPGAPVVNIDYNERVKGKVEYVGFFGSWDSPKYRSFFTFIRLFMAGIFLGLLYVNASIVCDEWFRAYILNNELHLWFLIIADAALLLMLGLLSSVAYKFYRHLKREEAYISDIAYEQSQYSYALYQELLRLKTELRDQFLNVENQLVNGSLRSSPNPSHTESMLSLSDRHYELWKHVAKMIRIFGYGYEPSNDPEMYESDVNGQISYRNLVDCFSKLEGGIWKMYNYGLDLKDDLTASDRLGSRLAELEGTIRMLARKVESADASILEITPALHSIAHSKDYFRTILVEERYKLSIRVLNLSDTIVERLLAKGIETVWDLSMTDMCVLKRWFSKYDILAIQEAMKAIEPYLRADDESSRYVYIAESEEADAYKERDSGSSPIRR